MTLDRKINKETTEAMRRYGQGDFKLDRPIPPNVKACYLIVTHNGNATWDTDFTKAFNRLKKKGYKLNQIAVGYEGENRHMYHNFYRVAS